MTIQDVSAEKLLRSLSDTAALPCESKKRVMLELLRRCEAYEAEKARRIHYQDLVYKVCNKMDSIFGGTIVCGTAEKQSTEFVDALEMLDMKLKTE